MQLSGRVAIVTGGAAGIGAAAARALAAEGAAVVVADVDETTGHATAAALDPGIFVAADVTKEDDLRAAVGTALSQLGRLDVLVNNAGGAENPPYPYSPVEEWTRVLDLNLRSVMVATQLALEPMRAGGDGAIVNVASLAGLGATPHGVPAYAAAKAAVIRLTTSIGIVDGVRVNCVCPDWVDTPASRRTRATMTAEELAVIPPVLAAEEVASQIVRLVRDDTLAGRVVFMRGGEATRLLPSSEL